MATEIGTPSLSQFQSVQKAMALPTVGAAVGQVGALYSRVKGAHSLLEWALSTAEASVTLAATTAAPFVAAPIAAGDARIAAAIDQLEKRVPIVSEEPKVIVETTKQAVLSRITPQLNKVNNVSTQVLGARVAAEQKVKSLKELTWVKANALLSTAYGQKAVQSVDTGAMYAMNLLDHYLPPTQDEAPVSMEVATLESDPTLHTVQTVGRLGAAAARRVWANLAARVAALRGNGIELDVRRYITALLAALHLAKVTSEQQYKEKAIDNQQQQKTAEPTKNIPPTKNETPTTLPTAEIVKSSPEAKSEGDE